MSGPNAVATAFLIGTAVVAAAMAATAAGKKVTGFLIFVLKVDITNELYLCC